MYAPRFTAVAGHLRVIAKYRYTACATVTATGWSIQCVVGSAGMGNSRIPPVLVRDGDVIATGYNSELDKWCELADGASDYLDRLEIREREKLGLDTLKVDLNCVYGYYIQVGREQRAIWC